ncbi:MAG: response regulator [Syntrophaceae bacterium]
MKTLDVTVQSAHGDARRSVLIVEDDPGLSDLIHKTLSDQGLGCTCTFNGSQALEWLAKNHADLLLLDYSLPDMAGSMLIESLGKSQAAPPFIVITGHGDEHIAVDMMKAGAQDYLVKDTALLDRLPTIVTRAFKDIEHASRLKEIEEESKRLQTRLMQVQKLEAIGTLAGGIAHDFNNILSTVLGYTELAKLKLEQGQAIAGELDEVLKAGIRARDLIRQILTFSRQADIQRTPLEIVPLIKETVKFLRASLPATIEIRQDLKASHGLILADPTQIHQVLMNLCTNATHAMQGEGRLEIRLSELNLDQEASLTYKGLLPGRYLRLSISDNGRGIPREIIDKIFDPFFTTKERGEGSGMGLAVVHGIIADMHGAITVASQPGLGTTFHVLFPALEGKADTHAYKPATLRKGHGRILFVDDEEGVLASGQGILEHLGYEVEAFDSAPAALEIFARDPKAFDLVLTDMTMPKMTGLEFAAQLRKIRPRVPIMLSTGFSVVLSEEMIARLGIQALIMKPLVAGELAEAVYHALHTENR